jgi:hypothetical protein
VVVYSLVLRWPGWCRKSREITDGHSCDVGEIWNEEIRGFTEMVTALARFTWHTVQDGDAGCNVKEAEKCLGSDGDFLFGTVA